MKYAIFACLMTIGMPVWAGEESVIELRYLEPTIPDAKPVTASHCAVVIRAPEDFRHNKETLGTTFRDNPIISKYPVDGWLQDALVDMKKLGLETSLANAGATADSANATVLSTRLEKMYIWNHGMNLHGTVVVKAKMQTGTGPEVEQSYRVISTKLNWANGDNEFVTTLNMAARRLLEQMVADINQQCQSHIASN